MAEEPAEEALDKRNLVVGLVVASIIVAMVIIVIVLAVNGAPTFDGGGGG